MISFDALKGIAAEATLQALPEAQLRDLQRALAFLTYIPGAIDGAYGKNTATAWAQFRQDIAEAVTEAVSASALSALAGKTAALDALLSTPAPDAAAVRASIVTTCQDVGLGLKPQIAYVLATAEWETNHTFKPVREAFWVKDAETWRRNHLKYWPYYGRGYVQLTWQKNYDHYGKILGLDLVGNPDLALDHYGSLFVIVQGFKTGAFTGHKLSEYVNATGVNFKAARFCINGQDKAQEIADIAQGYLAKL
jgi:hypothetical protein